MLAANTNIVVTTYNALEYTRATITSLIEKTNKPFYLTVVDNGSDKDTLEYLQSIRPSRYCEKYTIIKNKINMGPGYACNQGFAESKKNGLKYTCFCNNDLYFSTGWLGILEDCLYRYSNIAMVNPLRPSISVNYDNTGTSTMAKLKQLPEVDGWQEELEIFTGLPVSKFDQFNARVVDSNHDATVEPIQLLKFPDALSTCVCLVNNSHISRLACFADPDFRNYGSEDIDTSWRVMKLGYNCAVAKNVYIHHFRGKTLKDNKLNRDELLRASNDILYNKWRDEIHDFLKSQISEGVNVRDKLSAGEGEYWMLSKLNINQAILK